MLPYKPFNFTYDKQPLLNLYNESDKFNYPERIRANLPINTSEFKPFLDKFQFVPHYDDCVEISELTQGTNPHINPGNNGLLIFPISGTVSLKVYSYVPQKRYEKGRPFIDIKNLPESALNDIKASMTETINITEPIVVNGLMTHSLEPIDTPAVILVLKMPVSVQWNDVIDSIE